MSRKFLLVLFIGMWFSWGNGLYLRNKGGRRLNKVVSTVRTPMAGEPSCDDLRVMWRFSRRQSRMAEMTNELPSYRDPFTYNVWDEPPKSRTMFGSLRSVGRSWHRPVYGKIIEKAPKNHHQIIGNAEQARAYEEVLRYLSNANTAMEPRRKGPSPSFRLTANLPAMNSFSQSGSFQNLKQIIWAERAKELQQQRLLEEAALKAKFLKSIKGTHFGRGYGKPSTRAIYSNGYQNQEQNRDYVVLDRPTDDQYISEPMFSEPYSFRPIVDSRW